VVAVEGVQIVEVGGNGRWQQTICRGAKKGKGGRGGGLILGVKRQEGVLGVWIFQSGGGGGKTGQEGRNTVNVEKVAVLI